MPGFPKRAPKPAAPPPPVKRTVSLSVAAAHIFLSTQVFKTLTDRGVITKANGTGYDLDTVREQYIRHVRAIASGHTKNTPDGLDPQAEKARKDKEMADRVALQNAVTRGELAPISEFIAVFVDALMRFRSKVLAAPAKLAPRMEGMDRAEMKALLEAELEEALDEIKNTEFKPSTKYFVKESDIPDDED